MALTGRTWSWRAGRSLHLALALVLGTTLTGCRGCARSEQATAAPCPALDPPTPWLVLQAVDQPRGRLRLLGLDASGAHPVAHAAHEIEAVPMPNWPGHFHAVVAHAGALVAAASPAAGDEPGTLSLLHLDADGSATRAIPLRPLRTTALHLLGERHVAIGAVGALATIDLAAEAPVARLVDVADGAPALRAPGDRAFGLFARSGPLLVAIAEAEVPPWAEALRLDCAGDAQAQAAGALPRLVNGSYTEALLSDGELLLVAHYDIESGAGHLVARLALDRLSDPDLGNIVLNVPVAGRPPLAEEFEPDPDQHERPRRLLAGTRITPWAGLAVVADRLLIGAGERGILVLDRRFDGEEQASLIDVGGRCLDVTSRGSTAYALVESSDRTVIRTVVFDRPRARFTLVGETSVEGRWESFVR